jgi:hypothetical protein
MRWSRFLLASIAVCTLSFPAPAGPFPFFNRKAKPEEKPKPEERVPELIVTVKTDQDDHKRAAAAAELRHFDPNNFKEIVPILVDVLKNDPKTSVRSEAAASLSKIMPVTQDAGQALEYAAANDTSLRIRMQAKRLLIFYRFHGYHSAKKNEVKPNGDGPEPPLAKDNSPKHPRVLPPPKSDSAVMPSMGTAEPLPARPLPDRSVAQPLPPGPTKSLLVPADPPILEKPPSRNEQEEGPSLTPPP